MEFLFIVGCLVLAVFNWRKLGRIEKHLQKIARSIPKVILLLCAGLLIAEITPAQDSGGTDIPVGVSAQAPEPVTNPPLQVMHLAPETRAWYRNPDGSCVQCSIGIAGCHCNDIKAASLLWDTQFGPAVRGGSLPSRVEQYCDQRQIKVFNVTGETINDTMPWIDWAGKTGRFAAVGLTEAHFQTLYGFDPVKREYLVCNNNSTHKIDRYSESQFRQMHQACMPWCVILDKPSSPPPKFVPWWK